MVVAEGHSLSDEVIVESSAEIISNLKRALKQEGQKRRRLQCNVVLLENRNQVIFFMYAKFILYMINL